MARRKRDLTVLQPVPTPPSLNRALKEINGLGLLEAAEADPDAARLRAILADPRYQQLIEIVDLAFQVHGDRAHEWLQHPEPELGFVLPLTLLRDPANGPKLVKQTLMNHLRCPYALDASGKVRSKRASGLAPALPPPKTAQGD